MISVFLSVCVSETVCAVTGLAISDAPGALRETANGKGLAPPPPPPLPPALDAPKPETQQVQEEREGKAARRQLPDKAIYQPPAPRPAQEGENSASGTSISTQSVL